jgi:hypothetical protein
VAWTRARNQTKDEIERLRLEVDVALVERWRAAAEAGGLDLPDWIINVADCASGEETLPPPDEATPPSPPAVPEPYPPPDELDLPNPNPDRGNEGDPEQPRERQSVCYTRRAETGRRNNGPRR